MGLPALSLMRLVVAPLMMAVLTVPGVAVGEADRWRAAVPAVWRVAMEVPLMVAVAVSELWEAEVTAVPGANRSTQLPQLE